MTTDVLAYIADGGWHDTDLIAAGVGITNRSVAQQMRRHVAAGTVERSGAKPFSYRLAATDREAFPVVVAAPPPHGRSRAGRRAADRLVRDLGRRVDHDLAGLGRDVPVA